MPRFDSAWLAYRKCACFFSKLMNSFLKQSFSALLLLLVVHLLFAQCDKLPRNGALDGQWQVTAIDGKEVKAKRLYWRFQLDLVQFVSLTHSLQGANPDKEVHSNKVMSRFEHQGQQLRFHSAYLIGRTKGDILVTPEMGLDFSLFGFSSFPITFDIESLNSDRMVLVHDGRRIEFRKF